MANIEPPGRWQRYVLLFAVFACSLAGTWFLRAVGVWQAAFSSVSVLSLIGVLYQLVRDEAAYFKSLAVQNAQQRFDAAITSHMAEVAFDKHVAFCEEYGQGLNETLKVLMRAGTSAQALVEADKLTAIVLKHVIWVTPDIQQDLDSFDLALRKIGATAHLYNASPQMANATGRVEEMHRLFAAVLGLAVDGATEEEKTIAITAVMERARKILQVHELIALRRRYLDGAHAAVTAITTAPK